MPVLTKIKQKILQLDGGAFQILCDAYLAYKGYKNVVSLGTKSGSLKTTKGIPDTYFLQPDGKYIFVMYTTQQSQLYDKIHADLTDCMNTEKTGITINDISEIIYCHTSSNLSAGNDKKLHDYCTSRGVLLHMYSIDEISTNIYREYPRIAKDFLNIPLGTDQLYSSEEFVSHYDSNEMAAPLSQKCQFREAELNDIMSNLSTSPLIIIHGRAGIGKTRLALEIGRRYADQNSFKFICIQSNKLPIYEDLKLFLDNTYRYLILIDDADQISDLTYLFQYISERSDHMKAIITVRNYAFESVFRETMKFSQPEIINLNQLSDKEITIILRNSLGIKNDLYLEKIVQIAEGNARIAMLAGKLAVKTNSLLKISDASQLYDQYYGEFIESNSVNKDIKLCATSGIIAFLNTINLEKLKEINVLLNKLEISESEFRLYALKLHNWEFVDLYANQYVKISDQCFSNYLIYYVFVKRKIICLSKMIEVCFGNYRPRVINAINILGNVFGSDVLRQHLKDEIGIVWDDFEKSNNPLFFDFVKAFYVIKPTETLLILKERIDKLPVSSFDIDTIDFEKEGRNVAVHDELLTIIFGFKNLFPDFSLALDLLFNYFKKNPEKYMECYFTFSQYLSIDKDSLAWDYKQQCLIVNKFIGQANHWENKNVCKLFIRVAAEFLKILFHPSELKKGNEVTMYTISLKLNEGSKAYRRKIWESLSVLYKNPLYQSRIEKLVIKYMSSNCDENKTDMAVVEFDSRYIAAMFQRHFSPSALSHCLLAQQMHRFLTRYSMNLDIFNRYFSNNEFRLYRIFSGEWTDGYNWDKRKESIQKSLRILINQSDNKMRLIDCIFKMSKDLNQMESIYYRNNYEISHGIHYLFEYASHTREIYLYAIKKYLMADTPLNIFPDPIIRKLFQFLGKENTKQFINASDYREKNTWQFYYFKNIPLEQLSSKDVQDFYTFLSKKEGKLTASHYRDVYALNNFQTFDTNILIRSSKIIISKFDYSPWIFRAYFGHMFDNTALTHNQLIESYKDHLGILQDIYYKLLTTDIYTDYKGNFLLKLIENKPDSLDDYIKLMMSDNKKIWNDHYLERLNKVWECTNYIYYLDRIMNLFLEHKKSSVVFSTYLSKLLAGAVSEKVTVRKDYWLSQFITQYCKDTDLMQLTFEALTEIPVERRKKHIIHFLTENPDPRVFEKLSLVSNHWGGIGGVIPSIEKKITYLKSLLPNLNGLVYLRHKATVEKNIKGWEKLIEDEKIHELVGEIHIS